MGCNGHCPANVSKTIGVMGIHQDVVGRISGHTPPASGGTPGTVESGRSQCTTNASATRRRKRDGIVSNSIFEPNLQTLRANNPYFQSPPFEIRPNEVILQNGTINRFQPELIRFRAGGKSGRVGFQVSGKRINALLSFLDPMPHAPCPMLQGAGHPEPGTKRGHHGPQHPPL